MQAITIQTLHELANTIVVDFMASSWQSCASFGFMCFGDLFCES